MSVQEMKCATSLHSKHAKHLVLKLINVGDFLLKLTQLSLSVIFFFSSILFYLFRSVSI